MGGCAACRDTSLLATGSAFWRSLGVTPLVGMGRSDGDKEKEEGFKTEELHVGCPSRLFVWLKNLRWIC